MRVWECEGHGDYASGMIVVAAPSREKALRLATEASTWRGMCYDLNRVKIIKKTTCDVDKPTILSFHEYGE